MTVTVCPRCGKPVLLPPKLLTSAVGCPHCRSTFIVAAPAPAPALPPTEAYYPEAEPLPDPPEERVRCHLCGQAWVLSRIVRKSLRTGTTRAFFGNPLDLGNWIFGAHYERVDLCLDCTAKVEARRAADRRLLLIVAAMGGILFLVFLIFTLLSMR